MLGKVRDDILIFSPRKDALTEPIFWENKKHTPVCSQQTTNWCMFLIFPENRPSSADKNGGFAHVKTTRSRSACASTLSYQENWSSPLDYTAPKNPENLCQVMGQRGLILPSYDICYW